MKIHWILIALLMLSACYTGEVITVDTAIDTSKPLAIIQEPAAPQEQPLAPTPPQEETPIEEPAPEPRYEAPTSTATTYTGTVIVKTGPSSYRVRLPTNRELRILTREQLQPDDKITFTIDSEGTATILAITERPTDRTRY